MDLPNNQQQEIQELLARLAAGTLSREEWERLERLAAEDPFVADAIEGLSSPGDHSATIQEIRYRISRKLRSGRKQLLVYWSAAAGFLLVIIAGFLILRQDVATSTSATSLEQNTGDDIVMENRNDQAAARTEEEPIPEWQRIADSIDNLQSPPRPIAKSRPDRAKTDGSATLQATEDQPQKRSLSSVFTKSERAESRDMKGMEAAESENERLTSPTDQNPQNFSTIDGQAITSDETSDRARRNETDTTESVTGLELERATKIQGKVVDAGSGEPLIGANVNVIGSSKLAVTDIDGKFSLELPQGRNQLSINYVGYKGAFVNVLDRDSLLISLSTGNVLSEALVSEIAEPKKASGNAKEAQTHAFPEKGWEAFDAYINTSMKIPRTDDSGKTEVSVVLSFGIDKGGRPVHISVLQSGGEPYDTEAKRLLREGPDWVASDSVKNPVVEYQVRFPASENK